MCGHGWRRTIHSPTTTNQRNKLMTEITNTTSTAAVCRPSYCLTEAEVSCIRTGVEAAPGSWFAVNLDCACCGNTTVAIGPTCDTVPGPGFEVSRDEDRRMILTTTWLDGEEYTSEFWSVSVARAPSYQRSPRRRLRWNLPCSHFLNPTREPPRPASALLSPGRLASCGPFVFLQTTTHDDDHHHGGAWIA
jgi:hypothetical protein